MASKKTNIPEIGRRPHKFHHLPRDQEAARTSGKHPDPTQIQKKNVVVVRSP